jgi:3-keto-disaccharide hydrolase
MNWPPKVAVRLSVVVLSAALLLIPVGVDLAADEPAAQFTHPLFDGRTTGGWTAENGCEATVDEGRLVLSSGDGWLRSDHLYADFVLHVEWKALQASNYDAGIYIRTPAGGQPFPAAGYQVNLLEGSEGNIGSLPGAASTGLVRAGDWNAFDITVVGDKVSLVINGTEAYCVAGLKQRTGFIGLQCEVPTGGQFQFRNLWITEIGYRSLFNGVDLSGWQGAGEPAEKCWRVQSRLLQCTGTVGPWLRSAAEFGDFNLRLDYQVSAEGNSGVYVRVPADGNHHRENDTLPPAGFEVQVLDDAAPKHKDLKDYQFSASVYDIAGATRRVSKPAGQWNTLEIDAREQEIIVTHNGIVVVEVNAETFPLIKLRETKGFLGLQNHSTLVSFRNLRVGPPLPRSASRE